MPDSEKPQGICLTNDCKALQEVVDRLEVFYGNDARMVEDRETSIIADCLVKDGCAAEACTSGEVEFAVFLKNVGKLAARKRKEATNAS